MRKPALLIASALLGLAASPAFATLVPVGSDGISFAAFDTSTQGTLLDSKVISGQSRTFAGDIAVAVYRNTLGTIDFYYQFSRTGPGTMRDSAIRRITGSDFTGYSVDAFFSDADIDGAGIFQASSNPGAPATAGRSLEGDVISVDFNRGNPLAGTEVSGIYVFRTDATNWQPGTYGVIDGSTLDGDAYQPAAAVPEPATWGMFILGFGAAGAALRRNRKRPFATA